MATTTTEATTTTTEAVTTVPVIDGGAIYEQNCARCHSSDGSGGRGPNIQGVTDTASVVNIVTSGRLGMPSFNNSLSGPEIDAVAAWVTANL